MQFLAQEGSIFLTIENDTSVCLSFDGRLNDASRGHWAIKTATFFVDGGAYRPIIRGFGQAAGPGSTIRRLRLQTDSLERRVTISRVF